MPSNISDEDVQRVMEHLSPQARVALDTLSQAQHRPVQDVLRDEIRTYIAGRLPYIDIDGAMKAIKVTAYKAGWLLGRLKRFAREQGADND